MRDVQWGMFAEALSHAIFAIAGASLAAWAAVRGMASTGFDDPMFAVWIGCAVVALALIHYLFSPALPASLRRR